MQFDELAVLVKPASGLCNMACTYCFYRDAAHTRGIMPDATVQALLENVFAHTRRSVTFAFQGGEPTLAGLDFYRRFVERVEAQRPADMTVSYALQTNGIALDEAWASFLAENRFLVGLSIDGTASIHDKYRQTPNGAGTYLQVRQAAEALQAAGVEFNILTVLTKDLCRQAKKIYADFKRQGFSCFQFILCLAPEEAPVQPFVPTPNDYAKFLIDLFDVWYADWRSGQYHSVRYFDNLIRICMGQPAELCSLRGACSLQLVVEADGACYPCDFYVAEPYRLGNVKDASIRDMLHSAGAKRFQQPAQTAAECRTCTYASLCGGGCRRERFGGSKTVYCEAYRRFFQACLPRMLAVAAGVRRTRQSEI